MVCKFEYLVIQALTLLQALNFRSRHVEGIDLSEHSMFALKIRVAEVVVRRCVEISKVCQFSHLVGRSFQCCCGEGTQCCS